MRTLDRYVLKSFLANYVLALFVLISLYVVLDLFVNFDEFTEEGKSPFVVIVEVADYYVYNVPMYFVQLSGIITLFAACGTLARLQRQNEVTAVLACGTSLYRLAAPIVVAGLVMNALVFADYELVLPKIAPKLVRERDDVEGARVYDLWFVKDGPQRLLSAQYFSPKEQRISGLVVLERSAVSADEGQIQSVITADKAKWDADRHGWELTQRGARTSALGATAGGFGLGESFDLTPMTFYESELEPSDLLLRKSAQWLQFLSLDQLGELEKRGEVDAIRVANIRHARFTTPLSNVVLLLLGISFFMSRLPGSVLTQGAKALAVCAVAFMASFLGQQLVGSADLFSPALPHWLPLFIFAPVAVVLLDNVKT